MAKKIVKSRFYFEEGFQEQLAEVSTDSPESWGDNDTLEIVGKPVSRVDGYDKVSGTAVYAFDKIFPNMTYAKTLRCPYPHAKIKSIDTAAAEKVQGVLKILTHKNAPKIPWYGMSYLFDPHLRFEGDEVAVVVAETEQIAEDALKLIQVEYAELPFVMDAGTAMEDGAPQIHDSGNIAIGEIVGELRERVLITNGARGENPDGYSVQTFGAQFADVSVDTETGIVTVNRIVASHDIGRVLNRKTLENQFHGGMIQGMSYALMEERIIDQNTGKVLTTNLHNYKLPTVKDIPEMEIIIVSESDPLVNSTGVKGIGEPAIIPTAAAIANAVYNAIGVRIKSLPITPDKVLNALYG